MTFDDRVPTVQVRLLGPVDAVMGGRLVHVGSRKQRAVLAALALEAGNVVASDTLRSIVWGEEQPASAAATTQSLISRLRATLATASCELRRGEAVVIRTRDPGWVLDVDPDSVDALRFQALRGRARVRRARGETDAASADLAAALGLWRGAALVDVADAGLLTAQATRLDEARLDAVEDLAEAELETGHAAEALTRLEAHAESNRLRERGWGLLMVALYRLGRQAAALRAFQHVRAILGEELGIEPSPQLAEIERRILRHDPWLGAPGRSAAAGAGVWAPPAPDTHPPVASPLPGGVQTAIPSPASQTVSARAPTVAGDFADYSVVVVEDHDFQRRTVVQLLRGLGVGHVADAPNGNEALRLIEAGSPPDVIICDIDMPGMDGVEFVARVAERNLATAVVIASGLEANVLRAVESIGESEGIHVLAALGKPLTARRLGEVLGQYARLNPEGVDQPGDLALDIDELQHALRIGDLRPLFEPRVDLTTGVVSSTEVGRQWRAADGSPIPSAAFVPTLRQARGLLCFVERLVAESCELATAAAGAGLDPAGVRVALNLSLVPFGDAVLADRLTEIVQSRGQDPRRFVLQLDEITLARSPAAALSVLTRLRVRGFGLSMSHAGVGSSWTHQLDRVPLCELKVDRRLASGASDDPKRLTVLEYVLESAHEKGLSVVVGGCDSSRDYEMLLSLGCFEAQGAFLGGPMPASELVAWASTGAGLVHSEGSR